MSSSNKLQPQRVLGLLWQFLKMQMFEILKTLIQEVWIGAQEIIYMGFFPNFYREPSSLETKSFCFYGNKQ